MPTYALKTGQSLDVGVYDFGPFSIPGSRRALYLRIDKTGWPDNGNPVAKIELEYSLDGGITWPRTYTCETDGSIGRASFGVRLTWPQAKSGIRIKGRLTVYQPATFAVDLDTA